MKKMAKREGSTPDEQDGWRGRGGKKLRSGFGSGHPERGCQVCSGEASHSTLGEQQCVKEDMETCLQCLQHGGELWNFCGGGQRRENPLKTKDGGVVGFLWQ